MHLRIALPALASVCLLFGCEPPEVNDDDVGDGDGDADDTGTEAGTETGGEQLVPARGNISLTTVVVNQGVDVPVAIDGIWVGPEDRNTYLVGNRDSLIRAYWDVPEDWVPREIMATIDLEYPDGTTDQQTDIKMIDGDAFAGDLNRGFWWALVGDQFDPGLKFQIKLWEVEPGHEDEPESTTVLASPLDGIQLIGVQQEPMQLKVQMVPVKYDAGSCHTDTSTLTEDQLQRYINYMHEQNPIQELQFTFRSDATIQWNTQLNSLAELWEPLLDLRITDNAPPNMYYYAVVDVCGPGIGDAAGIAPGTPPPTKDAADARVCSGVWLGGQDYAYHVMVHEIGHTQGRPHTYCAGGGAAGTDPAYPHENGIIGVWGFGIRYYDLKSPTATFDYMSYCSPTFASDWTWSKTFTQARELTSWDFEDAVPEQPGTKGELLYGLLMPNGTERWYTTPGAREVEHFSGEQMIVFDHGDGEVEVPAAVTLLQDRTLMVVAPVPKPSTPIVALRRIDHFGESRQIDIDRLHSTTTQIKN